MNKREFHPEDTETSFWVRDSETRDTIVDGSYNEVSFKP